MIDTDAMKSRIEGQLAELRHRREHIVRDLAEPLNADSSEQAVELEDDAGRLLTGRELSNQSWAGKRWCAHGG